MTQVQRGAEHGAGVLADGQAGFEAPRTILVNSAVAAVLGGIIMIFLHELVHFVVGLALGHGSTLYPFGVSLDGQAGDMDMALIASSAVVFSLVTGFVCAVWLPFRQRGGFAHLLWLWFAFVSILEGAGYLVIILFGAGDTAVTAEALDAPLWVSILATAVGVALMFVAARLFAPQVRRHAGADGSRQNALAFWPWIIATVVTMAMALLWVTLATMDLGAPEQVAVVAAGLGLFCFAPMSFIFSRAAEGEPAEPLGLRAVPVAGIVGLAVMTAVNIALLQGFHLG